VAVVFLEAAQAELDEAIDFYEARREGLGREFAAEVKRTIERIVDSPRGWPKSSKHTRRCLTKRFPYGIIYQVHRGEIRIVAVTHLHRRPGYWRDRID
jgi:plasmid stabilization system protein ParE